MEVWWCKYDANRMQIWCRYDANMMQLRWKYDANLIQIWCKYNANLMQAWFKSDTSKKNSDANMQLLCNMIFYASLKSTGVNGQEGNMQVCNILECNLWVSKINKQGVV